MSHLTTHPNVPSSLVFTSSARNNGFTNVNMGTHSNLQMTQGADLTNAKHVYLKKSGGELTYDASDVIAKRRMAVGKNTTRVTVPNGNPSSNSNFVQNDVKSALAKVRGGGARVPPKVGMSAIKKQLNQYVYKFMY